MEVRHDAKSLIHWYFYSVSRAKYGIPGVARGTTEKHDGKHRYCCILLWNTSLELPELGASSSNAPEVFVTLRPTQSSKWTWRFSYPSKIRTCTRTESNKRDGYGEKRGLRIRYIKKTWYISKEEPKTEITVHGWWGLTEESNSTGAEPYVEGMNGAHRAHHKAG